MNKKVYYFSYGSKIKKIISKIMSFIYNLFVGAFIVLIYGLIISETNYLLKSIIQESFMNILIKVEICFAMIIIFVFGLISLFPQKAEILDGTVKIYRHCLFFSTLMIFRGFNDFISINEIEDIYIAKSKNKFFEPIPVGVIDWSNMVIIKTASKYYYVPIENSREFIIEVKNRSEAIGKI